MKDSQALKTACGSPNYAAPEIISGKAYSGVEVDIWSCGVILYAMVCGSLPFDDDSVTQLFSKIKEGKFYMPINISDEVKDLINRMLQPNPVKRISIPEIKLHPWYQRNLPLYLKELSSITHSRKTEEVDLEIVHKLFTVLIFSLKFDLV
jgi:serine/threonine protein kinase